MKKYMLVIRYCEEETYIYDSIEEMLKDWECNTIEELVKGDPWNTYTIYEISNIWSKKK